MRLCGRGVWGWPEDKENALRVLRRAVELGVAFVDTADAYGPTSTKSRSRRRSIRIQPACRSRPRAAARAAVPAFGGATAGPNICARPARGVCAGLRVECIELYQLHAIDPRVPFDEQIGALRELRDAGKIRRIGLSNVDLDELERAVAIVEIASVQNNYNVANRDSEAVLEYCEANGLTFIPYFPLDGGDLAAVRRSTPWRPRTARRFGRSAWRGCCATHRRCCRFPEPRRSRTSRRTWRPRRLRSATGSMPTSAR